MTGWHSPARAPGGADSSPSPQEADDDTSAGKRRRRATPNYLISRLAYRIQELAYGGLKPATRSKLDALADGLDPKAARKRILNGPSWGRS